MTLYLQLLFALLLAFWQFSHLLQFQTQILKDKQNISAWVWYSGYLVINSLIRVGLLAFLCIFEPFYELFHLFQKDTLSFGKVCIFIPFQDGFFTEYLSCGKQNNRVLRQRIPQWMNGGLVSLPSMSGKTFSTAIQYMSPWEEKKPVIFFKTHFPQR